MGWLGADRLVLLRLGSGIRSTVLTIKSIGEGLSDRWLGGFCGNRMVGRYAVARAGDCRSAAQWLAGD